MGLYLGHKTQMSTKYKVWQNGYHAEMAVSGWFIKQKVQYIHNNPVVQKIVTAPEHYVFSSAKNYAELENELWVTILFLG